MENNHKLALYVAYYLARFNTEALSNLGYSTWDDAFDNIGNILDVKRHSVKNWRDEFDPLFEHRAGWHQRPMSPSRIRVVQALENLGEPEIRGIVKDIISGKIQTDEEELEQLINIVKGDEKGKAAPVFILRGPTGKAAEEFFLTHYKENKQPIDGNLSDCRDLGVGYDFKIESNERNCFVEVKGLAEFSGGILFTDKEWRIAQSEGDNYFLCIVTNLREKPVISFIQNPSVKLDPKKNIYTTIQVSWSVTENQLTAVND